MQGETVQWMRTIAARKRAIITGSVIIKENEKYYNRLIWMLPDGKTGHYDKRHLFQYAKEGDHYTKGNTRFTASVNGWKILLLVCYDLRFPVWSRQQVNGGAEYDCLICVANWPSRRSTAWKTLLQARAIENQCYVVGVNRVGKDGNDFEYAGDSMVIDPLGSILYTKNGEEDVCTITLNKTNLEELRSHLPFLQDADEFNIIT